MKRKTLYPALLSIMVALCTLCSMSAAYAYGPEIEPRLEMTTTATCPPTSSVACVDDAIFETFADFEAAGGEISYSTGCSSISEFSYGPAELVNGNNYVRVYTMVADCGDPLTCSHYFTVTGNSDVVFSGCTDQTISTDAGVCSSAATIPAPTATDGCGNPLTVSGTMPTTFALGPNNVTFTANNVECVVTITVVDNEAPTVNCPADATVMCDPQVETYTTVADFVAAGGTVSDNCTTVDTEFTITHTDEVMGSCPTTIARTYEIRDAAGNPATCTQTITIDDTTKPVLTGCTDVTMTPDPAVCDMEVTFAVPTVTEDCGYTLYNTYTGDMTNTAVFEGGSTKVHWIATDNCGNSDTCTITVTLNMEPRITFPTIDITDKNNLPTYPDYTSFVGAGGSINALCRFDTTTYTSSSTLVPIDNCTTEAQVMVAITDSTGVTKQSIFRDTIVDMGPPVFTGCATESIIGQDPATCEYMFIDLPTVTDDCGVISNEITDTMLVGNKVTFTWTASDKCGNVATCEKTYTITDNMSPTVSIPDATVMCAEATAGLALNTFAEFEAVANVFDCNLDPTTFQYKGEMVISGSLVEHTYQIADHSGNITTLPRRIHIVDSTMPTFAAPADITVDCSTDITDLAIVGEVLPADVNDNCANQTYTINHTDGAQVAGTCPIKYTITRTWTVQDADGNTATDTQLITVEDKIKPVFDAMPADLVDINCTDPLPLQEVLTATDDCGGDVTVETQVIGERMTCSDAVITYMWIAIDACDNRDTVRRSFTSLGDGTGPDFSGVSTDPVLYNNTQGLCGLAHTELVAPQPVEDCSTITAVVVDNPQLTYPLGASTVIWEATNQCGRTSTFTQKIEVRDTESPTIVGSPDMQVSLTFPAEANRLYPSAEMLNNVQDNCGLAGMQYRIRRMAAGCGVNETTFMESVAFCCADIANGFNIEIVAIDAAGNQSAPHMMHIEVLDKTAPVVREPLPDLRISCSTTYTVEDLSIFGSYQTSESAREDILYYEGDTPTNGGRDGLVSDICDVTISETHDASGLSDCGIGTLVRTFTFTDQAGLSTTINQTIEITLDNIFDPKTGVEWPSMYVQEGCFSSIPGPDVAGRPTITNNSCSMLSIPTYNDEIYVHPSGGCDKIIRVWSFIDMCIYDGTVGKYTHEQLIKIQDTEAPVYTNPSQEVNAYIYNNGCSSPISSSVTATDNCTAVGDLKYRYTIDVNSDGSNVVSGTGNSFTHVLVMGTHTATWYVTDYCGNERRYTQQLNVVDKYAPGITCHETLNIGLTAHTVGTSVVGWAELWAKDLVLYGVDNCGKGEETIRYSFSSDPTDDVKYFTCADVGPQTIDVYATDVYGNQDFCRATVHVQDNGSHCQGTTSPIVVHGKIATEDNVPISETMVVLKGKGEPRNYMTATDGNYVFSNILNEQNYIVHASRDKNIKEGINVRDLLRIQTHLLGIKKITSPYKLIAADVDNSGKITPQDLFHVRKVILGLEDSFPNNTSWRFINKSDTLMSEHIEISEPTTSMLNSDFVGVKIGDVDNSIEKILRPETRTVYDTRMLSYSLIKTDDRRTQIAISTEEVLDMVGLQFSLNLNGYLAVESVEIGGEENLEDWTYVDGRLIVAYANIKNIAMEKGAEVITITVVGDLQGVELDKTNISMLVHKDGSIENIELEARNGQKTELYQNAPNPFSEFTDVSFYLENEERVEFNVYDMRGRLVYTKRSVYPSGYNTVRFDGNEIGASGMLMLKMNTSHTSKQLKIARLK